MDPRSDRIAAIASGVGVGLIVMMVAWLVGSRLASIRWEAPMGPTLALLAAVLIGAATTIITARRLLGVVRRSSQ